MEDLRAEAAADVGRIDPKLVLRNAQHECIIKSQEAYFTVHIKLDTGDTRFFNGIVTYFGKVGLSMNHTRYVAVLNPKLTLFDYARDCRIFFGQDAPALATDVLSQRGFTDVESGALRSDYRKREYCVQYRETDFNFIQRLLEEEGIYYFFKHENDKHTLVLADSATAHATFPGYESVHYLPKERKQIRDEEHFWSLSVAGSLYTGKFTVVRGYDYSKARPSATLVEVEDLLGPPAWLGFRGLRLSWRTFRKARRRSGGCRAFGRRPRWEYPD